MKFTPDAGTATTEIGQVPAAIGGPTAVRAPKLGPGARLILNPETVLENSFVTYTKEPLRSTTTEDGVLNAAGSLKGEPATAVRPQVTELFWKAETLPRLPRPAKAFATYTNWLKKSTATAIGAVPAEKGEPLTCVKTPVLAFILYADTLFERKFATKTQVPVWSTVTPAGAFPASQGEPAICVSTPVVASRRYPETVLSVQFAT